MRLSDLVELVTGLALLAVPAVVIRALIGADDGAAATASWANPIEAQFGPLRSVTMADSNHPNHTVLARELQAYLRWRN
jgi:hypothetical protein